MNKDPYLMPVAEFIEKLSDLPKDSQIYFGSGDLCFQRLKCRKTDEKTKKPIWFQIEFNELYKIIE